MQTGIAGNLEKVRQGIGRAAALAGRTPAEIELVAVTKTVSVARIEEAVEAGITVVGENRVQELVEKYNSIGSRVRWHLIGHLQTNKVKYVVDKVSLIHSLDRLSLAEEISRQATKVGTVVNCLVQVNVAEEESKFGLPVSNIEPFVREVSTIPGLRVQGLMTIGPFTDDPEEVRPVFRELRRIFEQMKQARIAGVEMRYLSMGMSGDYQVAIEEGANIVRVGSAIFGMRR